MNKLREKFQNIKCFNTRPIDLSLSQVDECEQITDDAMIKFAEWCGTHYIKLHGVWVGIYQDQRNSENFKTTTELLQHFKNNIYGK